jgi:hypothetical protein
LKGKGKKLAQHAADFLAMPGVSRNHDKDTGGEDIRMNYEERDFELAKHLQDELDAEKEEQI